MEIIDREQEKLDKEQTPEKKKNAFVQILWRVAVLSVIGIGVHVLGNNPSLTGEPYPIAVEDAAVIVYNGESMKRKPLAECKISSMEVGDLYEHAEEVRLLDIPFSEVTQEAVSANLGMEPEVLESGKMVWKKRPGG